MSVPGGASVVGGAPPSTVTSADLEAKRLHDRFYDLLRADRAGRPGSPHLRLPLSETTSGAAPAAVAERGALGIGALSRRPSE